MNAANTNATSTCPICHRLIAPGAVCAHGTPGVPPYVAPIGPLDPEPASRRRRSFMQILLDPRSIQWMLCSGGVLLVTGMVIWLASLGFFENPHVVAAALGSGTVLLLGAGWWVIRKTDLKLAGKAVTLLACLVMPLNLWFYQSHGLMTLDGHLWLAAVVCCLLYAASALVLRDPLFVYVLMAGVAGTGLLILTDMHRFAEIAAPSLMLVVMGLIGIHAERAFASDPDPTNPFTRRRFGRAFFASGHALLAGGLLLLLGAQIATTVAGPITFGIHLGVSEITTDPTLKLLAIAIVLAGTWAYLYSDLFVHRIGTYVHAAVITLLWAESLALQFVNVSYKYELTLSVLSLTALSLLAFWRLTGDTHRPVRRAGTALLTISSLSVSLMVASHLMTSNAVWADARLLGIMVLSTIAGSALMGRGDSTNAWRRLFNVMTVINAALACFVLGALGHLSNWQKVEIASVLLGLALLLAGHVGWYREQDRPSDTASFNLALGALLAGVPLLIAAVVHRFDSSISLPDELGLITIASMMLITGLMLQLRSTTITGGTLMTLHIGMLLASATWHAQLAVGVYLAVGGAAIFFVGLVLAIYREALLQLPERIRRREGVFKVLAWR